MNPLLWARIGLHCCGRGGKIPLPAIIIDLGTATKITVVTEDRSFIGGAILPGVKISLEALSGSASLLPSIGLGTGKIKTIGSNTVDCMLSGVVLGTACMVDGLIERYREELGEVPTVVACGGLSPAIVPHCRTNIILDRGYAAGWPFGHLPPQRPAQTAVKHAFCPLRFGWGLCLLVRFVQGGDRGAAHHFAHLPLAFAPHLL